MGLPNPQPTVDISQTQWYLGLTPARRARGGGTGATWRPWRPSTTTSRRSRRTRENSPLTVRRILYFAVCCWCCAQWTSIDKGKFIFIWIGVLCHIPLPHYIGLEREISHGKMFYWNYWNWYLFSEMFLVDQFLNSIKRFLYKRMNEDGNGNFLQFILYVRSWGR